MVTVAIIMTMELTSRMIRIASLVTSSILIGFVQTDQSTFLSALKFVPMMLPNTRDVFVKKVLARGTKRVVSARWKPLQFKTGPHRQIPMNLTMISQP